jgi:hypothetical protein
MTSWAQRFVLKLSDMTDEEIERSILFAEKLQRFPNGKTQKLPTHLQEQYDALLEEKQGRIDAKHGAFI